MTPSNPGSYKFWSLLNELVTRRAGLVLIAAAIVGLLAIAGAARLRPVASIESMLADDEPAAQALTRIAQRFGGMEELIILVSLPEGSPVSDDPADSLLSFAKGFITAVDSSPELKALCRDVRYRPTTGFRAFAESVVIPNALYYIDDDALASVAQRLTHGEIQAALRRAEEALSVPGAGGAVMRATLEDPLGLRDFLAAALPRPQGQSESTLASDRGFLSGDDRHLMVRVRGTRPVSDLAFADSFVQAVESAARAVNEEGLDLAFTGAYAIAAASQSAIRGDMIRSIVLSVIFLQVLYLIAYRNVWMLPAALAPVALGILVGFAVYAMLGRSLSPITAVIGAILAGLGIDYCIHSLTHYRHNRARGLAHEEATLCMLTDITPALIAACVTTVIGFLAIAQSSVRALRDFGVLGAMGLVASLIAAVVLLPAILTFARRSTPPGPAGHADHSIPGRVLRHAADHRRLFLLLAGIAAIAAGLTTISTPRGGSWFDNDLTVMHPRPNRPLETQRRLARLFPMTADPLLVYLKADSPEALTRLAYDVKRRLAREPVRDVGVVGTYGLASLLPDPSTLAARREAIERFDVERILKDFDEALSAGPFNPAAFADYRAFLSALLSSAEPPGIDDLLRFAAPAESVLPVAEGADAAPTEAITLAFTEEPLGQRAARDRTIDALRSALAGVDGATLTGLTVLGHDTERIIRRDLTKLVGLAAGVVLVWLVIYFRSIRDALRSLTPAIFGSMALLTCMRAFGMSLNTMNLIALPLLVGIGVDDGIFLVTVARRARRAGHDRATLVASLGAGCHAIAMTTATTVLTFGTLAFTSTPAIRSLGTIMAIGVTASLVGAVWILVPLLTGRSFSGDPSRLSDVARAG